MKRSIIASFALIPLAACSFGQNDGTLPSDDQGQETSRPETKNVLYRGTLLPLGMSIYMEGTHRLELEDGRFILLTSNTVTLGDYLNENVEVFGSTRPTVEGSAVIMTVERIAKISESSAAPVEENTSSDAAMTDDTASSEAAAPASSRAATVSSRAAAVASTPTQTTPSSEAAATSDDGTTSSAVLARAQIMAKSNMDAANWTQQYCSSHISFCIPVHKNWWFTSFGATSSSLWHVELSSEEIQQLGDGPMTVVLRSGAAPGPDGQVTSDGTTVTGIRTWTGNRHFVISAPAVLEPAVRYITQELAVAPSAAE